MKQLFFLTILFLSFKIYSQSTQTALNFSKKNYFHSTKLVSETITNTTFYNSNSIEYTKEITSFNSQNKVTTELRYDENDILKQRLTRMYDSTQTICIARKFENWHPLLGHTTEIASYSYDSNGSLINVKDKDQNGKIFRQTIIINDEKGNPIELTNFVGNEIIGKEITSYNYEKNEAIIQYFNKTGELVNSQTTKIEYSKSNPADIVNDYGDIVKSATYEMEIKYDKFGNWTKKKYSTITNGKLTKKSETTRIIKYLK